MFWNVFDFDPRCACCTGGLVSKREQKETISCLLKGKDVLASFILQADLPSWYLLFIVPLGSSIAYRGANQPKTSSILKLKASLFQKMSWRTYFQKICYANFVNYSHALRDPE